MHSICEFFVLCYCHESAACSWKTNRTNVWCTHTCSLTCGLHTAYYKKRRIEKDNRVRNQMNWQQIWCGHHWPCASRVFKCMLPTNFIGFWIQHVYVYYIRCVWVFMQIEFSRIWFFKNFFVTIKICFMRRSSVFCMPVCLFSLFLKFWKQPTATDLYYLHVCTLFFLATINFSHQRDSSPRYTSKVIAVIVVAHCSRIFFFSFFQFYFKLWISRTVFLIFQNMIFRFQSTINTKRGEKKIVRLPIKQVSTLKNY